MYFVLWLIFSWLIFLMMQDVSTSTLLTTCSFTEFDNSLWISNFANWLRYHVSFQVSVFTWLLCQSARPCLSCVACRSLSRGAVGPPTAFSLTGPCTVGVLPGPMGVSQSPGCPCGKEPTLVCVGWSRDVLRSVRTCSGSCLTLMCN